MKITSYGVQVHPLDKWQQRNRVEVFVKWRDDNGDRCEINWLIAECDYDRLDQTIARANSVAENYALGTEWSIEPTRNK